MMEAILKGFALGFVLALSVGPIIFTIIKQSLNNGHRGGFSFVAGVWLSDVILVVLSNMFTELVSELLRVHKHVSFVELPCPYGHDSFLIDLEPLARMVGPFLDRTFES